MLGCLGHMKNRIIFSKSHYNACLALFLEVQIWVILNLMKLKAGFSERAHTADWELEVWAPDFAGLLEQAARGMFAISGTRLEEGPRESQILHLNADDPESLLVKFLNELLLLSEQKHLGFDHFNFVLDGNHLNASIEGAPIRSLDKEIKAVTYHNLSIRETKTGLQVNIVFDV